MKIKFKGKQIFPKNIFLVTALRGGRHPPRSIEILLRKIWGVLFTIVNKKRQIPLPPSLGAIKILPRKKYLNSTMFSLNSIPYCCSLWKVRRQCVSMEINLPWIQVSDMDTTNWWKKIIIICQENHFSQRNRK